MTLNELKQVIRESLLESDFLLDRPESDPQADRLNQKEAAVFLGVSQTTIIKWKNEGRLPFEQLPGTSKIFYYKSELKKLVQKNRHLLQAARR